MIRDEITALRSLEGPAYRVRRDALLASGKNLAGELAMLVDSPAWPQAVTARILLGWSNHGALYQEIEQALDAADVERAQKTVSGIGGLLNDFAGLAASTWGEPALPFSWEALLKHSGELAPVKQLFHLSILRGVPHPLSVEVILAFMELQSEGAMMEAGARSLSAFPTSMTETRVESAYQKYDLLAGALQRLRVDIHYAMKEGR